MHVKWAEYCSMLIFNYKVLYCIILYCIVLMLLIWRKVSLFDQISKTDIIMGLRVHNFMYSLIPSVECPTCLNIDTGYEEPSTYHKDSNCCQNVTDKLSMSIMIHWIEKWSNSKTFRLATWGITLKLHNMQFRQCLLSSQMSNSIRVP